MSTIEDLANENYRLWIRAWSDRLGYCNTCGEEYKEIDQIEIESETCCPHCESNQGMTFFYCEEHGSPECELCGTK